MKSSRNTKPEPTEVSIGGVVIGGHETVVIAGPCAVEGHDHLIRIARSVKASGAHLLRGGAFKPRTSPYSFQGHGEEALKWLGEARAVTGLKIVSEVMDVRKVEAMARVVDCLQVGTRNMQNFDLLRELGRVPNAVLLKRGMSATIEEWLLAAEYILAEGNPNVILCERGIRTFESATRNTLDLSAIPVIRSLSHLPIAIDPSHGTGRRDSVGPMSKAAIAAGADAVMIEVHDDPERALSDGAQSLSLEAFEALMKEANRIAEACGRPLHSPRVVAFASRT
jgi:3-deoxy-7-phosphoheptulonate synthase